MFWTRANPLHRRTTPGNPMELFDRFLQGSPFSESGPGFPAFNIWTDDDGCVLTSELPGVTISELDITISGRHITIKGSRTMPEEESKADRARRERPEGNFERAFQLPFSIESGKVDAKLVDGVLQVTLPRAENDKPRKVSINGK